jgi:hypothetical protein
LKIILEQLELKMECRICQQSDQTNDNSLVSPCDCRGSVGFIHQKCLEHWVKVSEKLTCDLCKKDLKHIEEYNGLIPRVILRVMQLTQILGIIFMWSCAVLTLLVSAIQLLWGYYISTALTFYKLAIWRITILLIYSTIGIIVAFTTERFLGANVLEFWLPLGVTCLLATSELLVAYSHWVWEGLTPPVLVMGIYGLCVLSQPFRKMYLQHRTQLIFLNTNNE